MTNRASRSLVLLLVLGLATAACNGCESGGGAAGPDPSPGAGFVLFLVGDPGDLNVSEQGIRDRLGQLGRELRIRDDDGFSTSHADGCALVVMSKTVTSTTIGDRLKPVGCGVLFWEDNQQKLDMLATIDNDGSGGSAWHAAEDDVFVRGDAPTQLRADLAGERLFYDEHDEITWAPHGDLIPDATVVAEFDAAGGQPVYYVLDAGDRLADGSDAAGRRVYFGLYDDTFRLLTPDGLSLFDAAIAWALGG